MTVEELEKKRDALKNELKEINVLLEGGRAVGQDIFYVEEEILTYLRILEKNLGRKISGVGLYRTNRYQALDILNQAEIEFEDD